MCIPDLIVCILLLKYKYFSSFTSSLFSLKNPDSSILKFDVRSLLNHMYFAIILITRKLRLNRYNGKTLYNTLLL